MPYKKTPHIKNRGFFFLWEINFHCVKSLRFQGWLLLKYNQPVGMNTEFQITCSCYQRDRCLCSPLKICKTEELIFSDLHFPLCTSSHVWAASTGSAIFHYITPTQVWSLGKVPKISAFFPKPCRKNVYSCIVPGFKIVIMKISNNWPHPTEETE